MILKLIYIIFFVHHLRFAMQSDEADYCDVIRDILSLQHLRSDAVDAFNEVFCDFLPNINAEIFQKESVLHFIARNVKPSNVKTAKFLLQYFLNRGAKPEMNFESRNFPSDLTTNREIQDLFSDLEERVSGPKYASSPDSEEVPTNAAKRMKGGHLFEIDVQVLMINRAMQNPKFDEVIFTHDDSRSGAYDDFVVKLDKSKDNYQIKFSHVGEEIQTGMITRRKEKFSFIDSLRTYIKQVGENTGEIIHNIFVTNMKLDYHLKPQFIEQNPSSYELLHLPGPENLILKIKPSSEIVGKLHSICNTPELILHFKDFIQRYTIVIIPDKQIIYDAFYSDVGPNIDKDARFDRLSRIILDWHGKLSSNTMTVSRVRKQIRDNSKWRPLVANYPIIKDVYIRRRNMESKFRALLSSPDLSKISIKGSPGVGATTFLLNMLPKIEKKFPQHNILWFDAQNYYTLRESIYNIASKHFCLIDLKRSSFEIYNDILFELRFEHIIFIFDGASDSILMKNYLPRTKLKSIIITTNYNDPTADLILPNFNLRETVEYKNQMRLKESDINVILKMTNGHPSVLRHYTLDTFDENIFFNIKRQLAHHFSDTDQLLRATIIAYKFSLIKNTQPLKVLSLFSPGFIDFAWKFKDFTDLDLKITSDLGLLDVDKFFFKKSYINNFRTDKFTRKIVRELLTL